MNTEITDIKEFKGWVLYDADCRFCTGLARRFQKRLADRHFEILPLQTPWVRARLNLSEADLLAEMRVLKPDGRLFGGADALLEISRHCRLAWPFYQLGKIPTVGKLFHRGYRWVTRNRNCSNGACKIAGSDAKKEKRQLAKPYPGKRIVFFEMP